MTMQERIHGQTGRVVVKVAIHQLEGKKEKSLVAVMPAGVDLRRPVLAKVDGGKPIKLDYVRCHKGGCSAKAVITLDMFKAMGSGKQIIVGLGGSGRPLSFALPLTGFAAAEAGQPVDRKKYQAARKNLIGSIRARRAAQVKKAVRELDKKQQPQR